MFRDIKASKRIKGLINTIITSQSADEIAASIDELYVANENNRNCLTGKTATAINAFQFAYDPFKKLSIVSLKDRRRVIEYFGFNIWSRF